MSNSSFPVDVIVLAAGSGKRMNANRNKMFLSVNHIPVIYRTLCQFEKSEKIRHIYLVCKSTEQKILEKLICDNGGCKKLKAILSGGKERADSVRNALNFYQASGADGLLMVHDGARPFVSSELISKLIKASDGNGIVVPVLKVFETTRKKEAEKTSIVDRDHLYLTQTPQVFHSCQINDCYLNSSQLEYVFTDDASFFEAVGKPVKFVEGEKWNIKLTVSSDIEWAEAILNQFQFLDL